MSKFITSDSKISSEYSSNHADSSTSLMAGDEELPFDADRRGQFKGTRRSARRCFTKWQNWPLVVNLLFLVAGLSVWAHVSILVRSLRCNTAPEVDHFEPDRKYSTICTWYLHKLTYQCSIRVELPSSLTYFTADHLPILQTRCGRDFLRVSEKTPLMMNLLDASPKTKADVANSSWWRDCRSSNRVHWQPACLSPCAQ